MCANSCLASCSVIVLMAGWLCRVSTFSRDGAFNAKCAKYDYFEARQITKSVRCLCIIPNIMSTNTLISELSTD